jgi:hypothetical protein
MSCIESGDLACRPYFELGPGGSSSGCKIELLGFSAGAQRGQGCLVVQRQECPGKDGDQLTIFASTEWGLDEEGKPANEFWIDVDIKDADGKDRCAGFIHTRVAMSGPPGCDTPLVFDREKIAEVRRDYEDPAMGRPVADFTLDTVADDAAYSRALDRILTIDDDGDKTVLHVVDPVGKTETKLPISNYARALAVSPDGTRALVASVKQLVVVDIASARIEKTLPFVADTRAAAFLTNTRAAVLDAGPTYDSREGPVHLVDVTTGSDVTTTEIVDDYARFNVHPDGKTVYAFADRGGYKLARFDVGSGGFAFVRASASEAGRGSFLVFRRDGKAAIDFAGRLFTLSDTAATDMTVASDLKLPSLHMDGSPVVDELVRVPSDPPQTGSEVPGSPPEIRDMASGSLVKTLSLPGFLGPGVYRDAEPTHAFYSADGKWIHVIARAHDAPDSLSGKRAFVRIAR